MNIWIGLQASHQKKRETGVVYACSCFLCTFAKCSSALSSRWIWPCVNIQWLWSAIQKETDVITAIYIKTMLLVVNKWVLLHSLPDMAVSKRHRHDCKLFVFSAGCRLPGTEWHWHHKIFKCPVQVLETAHQESKNYKITSSAEQTL